MTKKPAVNKLAEMTSVISGTLEAKNPECGDTYQFSASYTVPRSRQILGTWKVIEHTVGGIPYQDVFSKRTFHDIEPDHLDYSATYEFQEDHCIKRVMVCGDIKGTGYDYRMNMVLAWSLNGKSIHVLPLIGYQYSCIDGKPAAVQDLSPGKEAMSLSVHCEQNLLVLTDGDDIKKLARDSTCPQ